MVKLVRPEIILAARERNPIITRPHAGTGRAVHEEFRSVAVAELVERVGASCRCCGVRFDVDTPVLRFEVAAYANMRNIQPTSMLIHRDDCLEPGFVQTVGFGNRMPNAIRWVSSNGYDILEANLKRPRVHELAYETQLRYTISGERKVTTTDAIRAAQIRCDAPD